MAKPEPGMIVAIKFPFSDLSQTKLRPALVLADAGKGDWVLCQITSKPYADPAAVKIDSSSFSSGQLPLVSYVRPGKLFTASEALVAKPLCSIKPEKHNEVVEAIYQLIKAPANTTP